MMAPRTTTRRTDTGRHLAAPKTRQRSVSANSFQLALEEDEAQTTAHGAETIGWVAIEGGRGQWSGLDYAAGNTGTVVTHEWYELGFGADLGATPRFLAQIGTRNGADNAQLRYDKTTLGGSGVDVMVEEDTTYPVQSALDCATPKPTTPRPRASTFSPLAAAAPCTPRPEIKTGPLV